MNYAFTHWFLLGFVQVGRWGCMRYGRNLKRHLWTGCTSSCHPELDSGSINAKKFQNFFIVFAKKCIFFTIIKLYNLFFRRKTYARFTKRNSSQLQRFSFCRFIRSRYFCKRKLYFVVQCLARNKSKGLNEVSLDRMYRKSLVYEILQRCGYASRRKNRCHD